MDSQPGSSVTYTEQHMELVRQGLRAIREYWQGANTVEKRSLLFCLDRYLDPYFGYELSFKEELIQLLERELFGCNVQIVKEDILQLLSEYASDRLDYLAEHLMDMDPELLPDAIYALGLTFNAAYLPIVTRFEQHEQPVVRAAATQALIELGRKQE
ncbi:HEAT repeat domain-containing protein [Paenibacillus massiliensis]|uniref:HEAT repeat domain-containing protein n=1 Tax=Paenibacillus massiliensis TaxID=225917 RepID=UPI0003F6D456|nr:hypothetical protein [Paenibacillus massiliensis]